MSNRTMTVLLKGIAACSLAFGAISPSSAQSASGGTAEAGLATPAVSSGQALSSQVVASVDPNAPARLVPAAYLLGSARLPDQAIAEWLASPKSMLVVSPAGGLPMVEYVKALVGSENRSPAALIELSRDADTTPAQQAALGTGLARAAQTAQTIAPEYAAYILESVAASQSPRLIAAFEAALSQTATAALGSGTTAASGSGSLGGGGTAGPSGGLGDEPTVVVNSSESFGISRGSASFSDGDTIIYQSPG